ncbi:UbiA family prenyltransferase [Tundrisphaera lichenicola]|uniref:UbiA family prenyltransferase n=1 Tax=Tundrisphaera lichenicola TaxID=2029860 RepID=UPI003EB87797
MNIKPYLQLVRLPNLFTAAADSLAGWLLVTGSLDEPARWVPLVLASVAIYAAGIVLNDVFDFEIDLRERPGRPLPSGKVSRRLAAWFGAVALLAGPGLAALSGSMSSLFVASILAACVLGYDAGLKRTVLGPEAMGTCRGLNLLLGMSQAPDLGGPIGWLAAGSLALFVVGVTWISRSEVESGKTRGLLAGLTLQNLAFLGLVVAMLRPERFPGPEVYRSPTAPAFGGLVLLAVGFLVNQAGLRAYREPVPSTFQRAVKTGVLSLVWLDVALVACVRGPGPALAVAALWVPAFLLGKWLYST